MHKRSHLWKLKKNHLKKEQKILKYLEQVFTLFFSIMMKVQECPSSFSCLP